MTRHLTLPDSLRAQLVGVFALAGLALAGVLAVQLFLARERMARDLVAEARNHGEILTLELAAEAARALEAATQGGTAEVARLTAARDRAGLQQALAPHYEALRARLPSLEQYQVFVPDRPAQASGQGPFTTALLRMQAPTRHGDDVSGWRIIMNAGLAAGCAPGRSGFSGLEMSTSGVAMHGVVTLCHDGQVAGVLNIGFRLDRSFFEAVAQREPGSYALYLLAEPGREGRPPSFRPLLQRGQVAFDPARHLLHPAGAMHPAPRLSPGELAAAFGGAVQARLQGESLVSAVPVRNFAGETIGVLESITDGRAAAAAERELMLSALAALLAVGVVMGLGLLLLDRRVRRPLAGLVGAVGRIEAGDTAHAIPATRRGGEVGALARAVEQLRSRAARNQALEAEAAAARAERDAARRADQAAIAEELERIIGEVARRLAEAGEALRRSGAEAEAAGRRSAARTEQTAGSVAGAMANVQAVAAAAEELATSVTEITRQVAESARGAADAAAAARASDSTVTGLSQAADRIGDVVRLISDIAGQTNLLALNATIEAARAGEAGKGFAVVAGEVKSLAAQTAKATEEISAQILAMRGATQQAVSAVRGITGAVSRLDEVTAAIAAAVEQQGAATREIARNAAAAATSTEEAAAGITSLGEEVAATGGGITALVRSGEAAAGEADTLRERVASVSASLRAA